MRPYQIVPLATPAATALAQTMFSSAKGKPVNVSASALEAARSRYADSSTIVDAAPAAQSHFATPGTAPRAPTMCSSAKGETVSVSATTLEAARSRYADAEACAGGAAAVMPGTSATGPPIY